MVSESLVLKLAEGGVKTFTSKEQLSEIQQSDQKIPMLLLFSRGRCLEMGYSIETIIVILFKSASTFYFPRQINVRYS